MATTRRSSKRSAHVILTAAAAIGMSAHAQGVDPCDAAMFNGKACQAAVRHKGFCSGGAWVPMTYSEKYPYFYDKYQSFISGGGVVTPFAAETCKQPGTARGGFGIFGTRFRTGG
jgi:hypothetical protein